VSYEPEDRYWTDYLRVALPVIGLLLMLGLLVWWANSIIGNDRQDRPTTPLPTATAGVAQGSTETPTEEPGQSLATQPADETATVAGGGNGEENTPPADETQPPADDETPPATDATEPPDECDGDFTEGQNVVVTADEVRMREEPEINPDNIVATLGEGTALTISSECYKADDEGTQFWRVTNEDTGDRGWVSAEYLQAD
jgi:cytoskeletal protein RodZ